MEKTNNKRSFSDIIATISIAVLMVFWTLTDRRLQKLEDRLRRLELQTTAISVRLGIDTEQLYSSETTSPLHNQPLTRGKLP